MKNNTLIIILFILIGCNSGNNNSNNSNLCVVNDINDFGKISLAEYRTVKFDSLSGQSTVLKIIDSIGFITNIRQEQLVSIVNLNNGNVYGKFINRGKAGDELVSDVGQININSIAGTLGVWEFMGGTYLIYSIDSVMNGIKSNNIGKIRPIQRFRTDQYVGNLLHINTNKFIATTLNLKMNDNRILILDSIGNIIEMKEKYYLSENFDKEVLFQAYEGHFAVSYKDSLFVIANKHTDLIEIYDLNGNLKKNCIGPYNIKPNVEKIISGNSIRVKNAKESKLAYSRPIIKDSLIWTIVYDKEATREKETTNQIITFDLNGNGKYIYTLTHNLDYFEIDEDNKLIYAMNYDNDDVYTIHVYKY